MASQDKTANGNTTRAFEPEPEDASSQNGTEQPANPDTRKDVWYYPADLANDLQGVDLPKGFVAETLAYAFEYTKCVIPHYTNWARYIAYQRLIAIAVVAEYRGALVDITASPHPLGYDVDALIDELFGGTRAAGAMRREFKASILFTADKASSRRRAGLFRRYVDALAASPRQWFRLRDCDGLARFTVLAALACNDLLDADFTDPQLEILGEIGLSLYDAVAFYKHRAEGETHSTFAYAGDAARAATFARGREVLWALDAAATQDRPLQVAINFVRFLGGPIQTMMRRYRFVEEGLRLGVAETERVEDEARRHVRLWHRVEQTGDPRGDARFEAVVAREDELLIPGMADMLRDDGAGRCGDCRYRLVYGAEASGRFGGVQLCGPCTKQWQDYLETLPSRAIAAFPVLDGFLKISAS